MALHISGHQLRFAYTMELQASVKCGTGIEGLDDILGGGFPTLLGQTAVPTYFGKADQILTQDAGRKPKLS